MRGERLRGAHLEPKSSKKASASSAAGPTIRPMPRNARLSQRAGSAHAPRVTRHACRAATGALKPGAAATSDGSPARARSGSRS